MNGFRSIPVFTNLQRFDKRVEELQEDLLNIKELCPNDAYTLVLHKHLGDIFYAIGAKKHFESVYGGTLHFIIRPQHEFLMKLWGVDSYKVYDLDRLVKKNTNLQKYYFDGRKPSYGQYNWLEDTTFQAVFPCVPIKGFPFICDSQLNNFFKYPRYWCYRWSGNMGINETFRFSVPKNEVPLSERAYEFCMQHGGLDKIVLFAPEAQTATELPKDFWDVIAEEVHQSGYTIVVNSKKFSLKYGICAFDFNLSLEDIVAIGLKCAYVFSLRSGLCDVLVGAGERLYAVSPAILRREDGSLTIPFDCETHCNEIQLHNWTVPPFVWRGMDLQKKLQQVIDNIRKKYLIACVKRILIPSRKNKSKRYLYNDMAGRGFFFPESNAENRPNAKKVCWGVLGFKLYSSELDWKNDMPLRRRMFFGGAILIEKTWLSIQFNIFGIPFFSSKSRKKRVIRIFGIPVWFHYRKNEFFCYLKNKIEFGHDHVYIIRHNIGETFVYLSYLQAWIKANNSQNPLILVWREKDLPLYQMFLGDRVPLQLVNIAASDIHAFFRDDVTELAGMKIFTPTFEIAEAMKRRLTLDNHTNFKTYILESMGLLDDAPVTNKPFITLQAKEFITKQLKMWGISGPYALLCPEATSLVELPLEFWNKISQKLQDMGYKVIVNARCDACKVDCDVVCHLRLDELYELASRANKIITLASGLSVLLSTIGVPIVLLYTAFKSRSLGYDAQLAIDIYSVKHLDQTKDLDIQEINVPKEGIDNILSKCVRDGG